MYLVGALNYVSQHERNHNNERNTEQPQDDWHCHFR
jgi:hypothetical protein